MNTGTHINKIAAFSDNNHGGNPAGVAICESMLEPQKMQNLAKELGYSETAFLHKHKDGWRIRYFAPELEVPFCGHATIASGYVLGTQYGPGDYTLYLSDDTISISVTESIKDVFNISFNSPPTFSEPAPSDLINDILGVFNFSSEDIDPRFPVHLASAGAKHLIIVLAHKKTLSNMSYLFEGLKALMVKQGLVTINLLYQASDNLFHSRNPFPPGGVYEDPATGAAAAAFAGYLRDIGWAASASFEVLQGEEMDCPSKLFVKYQSEKGSSITVSGQARRITEQSFS